jgi:YD repeat-containing protein
LLSRTRGGVERTNIHPTQGVSGGRPHAHISVGGQAYAYDSNCNTLSGGDRVFTWDAENRLISFTKGGATTRFTYWPDGTRQSHTNGLHD